MQTENRNKRSMNLSKMNSLEIVNLMNNEDKKVIKAIKKNKTKIAKVIDMCVDTYLNDGKIIYVGAGTSGRIAFQDVAELYPTFNEKDHFMCFIAGGNDVIFKSKEDAEDDQVEIENKLKEINLTSKDIIIGISASGNTKYVLSALRYGFNNNVKTVSISNNKEDLISKYANVDIHLLTHEEILTGSTRLKAGTSQKMVLNMISTATMAQVGKVYENYMIDMVPSNTKLINRAVRIISSICNVEKDKAIKILTDANYNLKIAIVMAKNNVDIKMAKKILMKDDGFIK